MAVSTANTPLTRSELLDAISALPPNGWWHSHNEDALRGLAEELVSFGLSPQRALDVLAAAYGIVADEYGE